MAKLLINAGANVNTKNKEGQTVFHSVFERISGKLAMELADIFIAKGSNVNEKLNMVILHYIYQ